MFANDADDKIEILKARFDLYSKQCII